MTKYILDADWIIEALKGRSPAPEILKEIDPQHIGICPTTIAEVYEGAFGLPHTARHMASFRQFLKPFVRLDFNDTIMETFAVLRHSLRKEGKIISDFDILLGATALHYNLTILTFNRKHLSRIPKVRLYESNKF